MEIDPVSEIKALLKGGRASASRRQLAEALRCYEVGAYRSCVVMTWSAVVVDLLAKAKELTLLADDEARARLKTFNEFFVRLGEREGFHARALELDRVILQAADEEYGLIDPHERSALERLRKDRDRARHPGMQPLHEPYDPSPALVRTHLRSALSLVLRREALQGERAFAEVWSGVCSSSFPVDRAKATLHLDESPMRNARRTLARRLLIRLIESLLLESEGASARARKFAALAAMLQREPELVAATLRLHVSRVYSEIPVDARWRLLDFFAEVRAAWKAVDEPARAVCHQHVREYQGAQLIVALHHANRVPELAPHVSARVEALSARQLLALIRFGDLHVCKRRVIELYRAAASILGAEWIGQRLLLPVAELLDSGQLRRVLLAASENRNIYTSWVTLHEVLPELFERTRQHVQETAVDWWRLVHLLHQPDLEPPELADYGALLIERIVQEFPERPDDPDAPWFASERPLIDDIATG